MDASRQPDPDADIEMPVTFAPAGCGRIVASTPAAPNTITTAHSHTPSRRSRTADRPRDTAGTWGFARGRPRASLTTRSPPAGS
ncbi:MAG: hypothetical protein OXF61_16210 [Acidimicrobiaceae bacterium]|nr:hypothetical protein [Acidimicrobiaceae bacterium]